MANLRHGQYTRAWKAERAKARMLRREMTVLMAMLE
jgi:hypothetical protein